MTSYYNSYSTYRIQLTEICCTYNCGNGDVILSAILLTTRWRHSLHVYTGWPKKLTHFVLYALTL